MIRQIVYILVLAACCTPLLSGFPEDIVTKWWLFALLAPLLFLAELYHEYDIFKQRTASSFFALSNSAIIVLSLNIIAAIPEVYRYGFSAPVHGTFDNPSGYALSLCILIPVALWHWKLKSTWQQIMIFALILLAVSCILLTRCRTGILCLSILFCWLLLKNIRNKWHYKFLIVIIALSGILAYVINNKKDSSEGRMFIMKQTCELIKKKPVFGYGMNGFHREYMLQQAEYFKNNKDIIHEWLADEVRHPLNEFLYVWVNWGVVGFLALMWLSVTPFFVYHRKKDDKTKIFLPVVMVITVFSLLSYPYHYPLPWFMILFTYLTIFRKKICQIRHSKMMRCTSNIVILIITLTVMHELHYIQYWEKLNYFAANRLVPKTNEYSMTYAAIITIIHMCYFHI